MSLSYGTCDGKACDHLSHPPLKVQYLTLMCMELHARTRRDLEPDPEFDPICALFYCLNCDAPLPSSDRTQLVGAIVVDKDSDRDQGDKKVPELLHIVTTK